MKPEKKIFFFPIILCFTLLFLPDSLFSQPLNKTLSDNKGWTTDNPFQTDVYVENQGQFDTWAKSSLPIKYAVNNSDKIFFTSRGIVFRLEKFDNISEEEADYKRSTKYTIITFLLSYNLKLFIGFKNIST
jgi:hypothetical protein